MPCVNDHPQFLEMVASWADTQISELMKEAGQEVNLQFSTHHHHH
jgi:ferrochelatase